MLLLAWAPVRGGAAPPAAHGLRFWRQGGMLPPPSVAATGVVAVEEAGVGAMGGSALGGGDVRPTTAGGAKPLPNACGRGGAGEGVRAGTGCGGSTTRVS